MQGIQIGEKGSEEALGMAEQIAVFCGENKRFGEIAALVRQLLQSSKEQSEELKRLRRIEDEMRSKEIEKKEMEVAFQAKKREFAQKEAGLRSRIENLQNRINSLKNEDKDKLNVATQQIEDYKQKLDELTQQNIVKVQSLEKQINEMSQNLKTTEQSRTKEYQKLNSCITYHQGQADKHQKAFKAMEIDKLRMEADQVSAKAKYEKERRIMDGQVQKEKREQQQQLRDEQANNQRLNAIIKKLQAAIQAQRNTIEDLTAQKVKQSQAYKSILTQMQALKKQCQQKIVSEITKLNSLYLGKIDTISKENQQLMSKIKTNYNQSIDMQNQAHIKELDKLNEQIRILKEENESNSRSNALKMARIISQSESSKQELTDMLKSIYSVVLGRTFEAVQNQQITRFVQKKFNDLTAKVENLGQANESSRKQCESLRSQLSSVKKVLNNFSVLFNNPEILNALDKLDALKTDNFVFSDQDLLESIKTFTKRLASRLKECKVQMNILEIDKGELLSQQFESARKVAELGKKIELLEGKLKREDEYSKELLAEQKDKERKAIVEKLIMQGSINTLNDTVEKLNKDIASLRKQVDDLNLKIKRSEELNACSQQNSSLKDHLANETSKNERISQELRSLKRLHEDLNEENTQLLSSLELAKQESQQSIYDLKSAMSQQQQQYEACKQRQIDQINDFISNHYDSRDSLNSFDAFLDFLRNNQATSDVTPFTVSHIFERAAKEKQILITQANKFLQSNLSSTTLLYKYDEFNKNFSNYLPIRQNYSFLILAKTKQLQIFGVLSTGLGKGSKALALNLTQPKFFESNPNNASSSYEGGYLIFGHGEVRFRNNWNLQVIVNSRIFGTRHFTFRKEQLVGRSQEGDSVQLQAIQIHRLNY